MLLLEESKTAINIAAGNNGQMVTVAQMNALVAAGASLQWGWDVSMAEVGKTEEIYG